MNATGTLNWLCESVIFEVLLQVKYSFKDTHFDKPVDIADVSTFKHTTIPLASPIPWSSEYRARDRFFVPR